MSDESDAVLQPAKLAAEIENSVGRLLQLAIRVRRESARRTIEEAAKFEPRDETGNLLTPEFEKYIGSICHRAFGKAKDSTTADDHKADRTRGFEVASFLKERAQKCMVDRWRRISYQRHHASNLEDPSQKTTTKAETQKAKAKPVAPPLISRSSAQAQVTPIGNGEPVAVATKATSAATSLPAHIRIDQKTDLRPKTALTVTTKVRADHLEFPRAPKVRDGLDKFKCPLCGLLLPSSLLDKRKWQ